MKNLFRIALAAVVLALSPVMAKAQVKATPATIAHFDMDSLLERMPEFQKATDDANAYYKQLEDQLYKMELQLDRMMREYDSLKATWSPLIRGLKEKEITDAQYNIQVFQQQAQVDFANKRAELVKPVYDSIITAVKEVAQANGFKYVIDSSKSTGVVLYSAKEYDIFGLLVKRLRIPPPPAPKTTGGTGPGTAPAGGK
jgi:outer membrane protein